MESNAGQEPIADEETIYRRIPKSMGWYENDSLSPLAFAPRKDDLTGISVSRAKYKSLREAAQGMSKHGYLVAVLNAGTLRENNFHLEPRSLESAPGHAEIVDLVYENRNDNSSLEQMERLRSLCLRVEDPAAQTN